MKTTPKLAALSIAYILSTSTAFLTTVGSGTPIDGSGTIMRAVVYSIDQDANYQTMAVSGSGYDAWFDMDWEITQAEVSFHVPYNTNVAISIAYGGSIYIGNSYRGYFNDSVYESGMTTGPGAELYIPADWPSSSTCGTYISGVQFYSTVASFTATVRPLVSFNVDSNDPSHGALLGGWTFPYLYLYY